MSAKDTKSVKKDPEMAEKFKGQVRDDLGDPSCLNLDQSVRKGQNKIGLDFLSTKDAKSLKLGPEMAEKLKGQFGSTSPPRVTST